MKHNTLPLPERSNPSPFFEEHAGGGSVESDKMMIWNTQTAH
jgi:hypothetical protein